MKKIVSWALAAAITVGAASSALAAAGPSYDEVNNAVRAGHLQEAQSMMLNVLSEHPNSAKAHFVEAEVLERLGRRDESARELGRADQLDPGLHSIPLDTVQKLRARLASPESHAQVAPVSAPAPASFPWGPVLLIGGAVVILILLMRARRPTVVVPAPVVGGPGYGGGYGAAPYGGYGGAPYGGAPMGGGVGSGIMGGLATGVAVGAGMVAGEALANEFIGHHGEGNNVASSSSWDDRPAVADTSDLGVGGGGWDSSGSDFASGGDSGGGDWS